MSSDPSSLFSTFLLGSSSLIPLINPIGTAFIIQPYFSSLDDASRRRHVLHIVVICFVMDLVALHLGSLLLKLMGVSIPASASR
jgi:multiple antibiotic resistance protein